MPYDVDNNYIEPEFQIIETEKGWVIYEAIAFPFKQKDHAERWLIDVRPYCFVCSSHRNEKEDPLECYSYSRSGGGDYLHASCNKKFEQWCKDHPGIRQVPPLRVIEAWLKDKEELCL